MKFSKTILVLLLGAGFVYLSLQLNSPADKALLEAAGVGDLQRVEEALHAGANVNARDFDRGASSLILATVQNHTEVVKKLVQAKAKLDVTDGGGSALYYACLADAEGIAAVLHAAGARAIADKFALEKMRKKTVLPLYCR